MRRPPMWLENAVDQLDVPLLLVGADRSVTYANHAAHRLFGLPPGHLEGAGVERLVVPERRGELRNVEDVLAGGGKRRVRSVLRREDGSRIDVTMQLEPCFDVSGDVGAVSIRYEVIASGARASMGPGAGRGSLAPGEGAPPSGVPARPSMPAKLATTAPPPRNSEQRLRAATELEARLQKVQRQLQWLEERLSVPASIAPLDDDRERARAMFVVSEARGLVSESLAELRGDENVAIPAAPKVPKM